MLKTQRHQKETKRVLLDRDYHGFRWYHDRNLDKRFIKQSGVYKNHISNVTYRKCHLNAAMSMNLSQRIPNKSYNMLLVLK